MGVSPRVVECLTREVSQGSRKKRSKISKCVCHKWKLTGWHGSFFRLFLESLHYFLETVWFRKVYVAFSGWQVDFGKFYRFEKIEKAKFKMSVSPRVVDWLTPEVSRTSRKSRSKFLKCICRKWQLTGWHGSFFSLCLKSLDCFLESFWFWERYVVFGSWQVDFWKI